MKHSFIQFANFVLPEGEHFTLLWPLYNFCSNKTHIFGLQKKKSKLHSAKHSGPPCSRTSPARSLSRSPSSPPPSFTQYPSPPRSLVRDGQTSSHRPRLVVSRSTCPPFPPPPSANSFVIGTAVINTHTPQHSVRRLPGSGQVPCTSWRNFAPFSFSTF